VVPTAIVTWADGSAEKVQVPGVGPGKIPPETAEEVAQIDVGLRRALGDRYGQVHAWQEVES
jgi:hypothetical protein